MYMMALHIDIKYALLGLTVWRLVVVDTYGGHPNFTVFVTWKGPTVQGQRGFTVTKYIVLKIQYPVTVFTY